MSPKKPKKNESMPENTKKLLDELKKEKKDSGKQGTLDLGVAEIGDLDEAEKESAAFLKRKEEMQKNVKAKELIDAEISPEMREAYLNYAMSVIVARALPSAEDGLKPVHRRILWTMHKLGLQYNKQIGRAHV